MSVHPIHTMDEGDAAHQEAQALLPWLANGRLAGTELERVQAHLQGCPVCRAELALLHTLRAAGADSALSDELDVERALAKLLPQLDAQADVQADAQSDMQPRAAPAAAPTPALPVRAAGWRARLAANDARWLRAAVGLQCCVIAVLGVLLARPSDSADAGGAYRVLGATPGAQGSLVVSFKPDTPEREVRRIVLASGAHVAAGPTATGAWVLATEQPPGAVAARLHAESAVTLAEPLGQGGTP